MYSHDFVLFCFLVAVRPKIKVSNQLVGSSIGSDVQLECRCEASPTPTTSWIRYDGHMLFNSSKYLIREEHDSYRTKMKLKIINLDDKDFGSYKCVSKNSLGEKEGLVRLYGQFEWCPLASTAILTVSTPFAEIASPSTPNSLPTYIYSYDGHKTGQEVGGHFPNGSNMRLNIQDQQWASSSSARAKVVEWLAMLSLVLVAVCT